MPAKNGVTTKYYSGQGIVLVAERDANGDPKGFRNLGNCPDLKVGIEVSTLDHKESTTGQRATDKRITQETKGTFTMVLEDLDKDTLALALRGDAAAVVAGSVTDEAVIGYLGSTVALKNIDVSTVVVTNVGATVTYEEGKNYEVNPEVGSITIYTDAEQTALGATANTTADQPLLVDYDFAAHEKVDVMTQASKEYVLRFEGMNTANDNKPVLIQLHKIEADPLNELSLISDEIQSYTLTGSILSDSTKLTGSKFFVEKIGL